MTSVIRVKSNVSGGGPGCGSWRGAFSSTTEVWDGGWRAVTVSGCLLRSLLKPILSDCRGKRRKLEPVGETERKSMELLETILSLGTTLTHAARMAFSCSLYLSLTPSFPFISPLFLTFFLIFLWSWANVWPPPIFFPSTVDSIASNNAKLNWMISRLYPEIWSST